jgi:hypothetical protein
MGDHVRGVAAVASRSSHFMHVLAGKGAVAPAVAAIATGAPKPAHSRPRADAPAVDVFADRVDDADDLVTRNARVLQAWQEALNGQQIAVTDPAGMDADAHLLRARGGNVPLFRYKPAATLPNNHRAHFCHCRILFDRDGPASTQTLGFGPFARTSSGA